MDVLDSIQRKSKFVRSLIKEVGANLLAVNLYPLGVLDRDTEGGPHSSRAKNPRPILLVHGIVHNKSAFLHLKFKLDKLGWENVYTMNYSTVSGHVLHMVDELARRVDRILSRTGSSQIDIIAHSLGGIVARTYMTVGEGRGKIRKLITLGTPHQGTYMSFIAKGLSRGALDKDLRVNSFLIRLLSRTALPRQSEVISIYSPFDWTVVPGENGIAKGIPETAFKNVRLENVGHASLLYSNSSLEAVVDAITDETEKKG